MGFTSKKASNDAKKNRVPPDMDSKELPVTQHSPTLEEIRYRAYDIYLSKGATDGHDLEHWLEAESDLSWAKDNTDSSE